MQSQPPGQSHYGASPSWGPPPGPPKKKPALTFGVVILLVIGGLFVAMGPLAVLAIYGVRKYISNAKTAEARNVLRRISSLAVQAYERDGGKVCPSASRPIPASTRGVRGSKYLSDASEWAVDESRHAGFACLGFSMDLPQYYQYSYRAEPGGGFVAEAHGDLNGDGKFSTFRVRGEPDGAGSLRVAPSIEEIDPTE